MDMEEPTWAPAACTLPPVEQPLRAAEFDELFAAALLAVDRPAPGRLSLALDPASGVAGRVADLAAREVGCCSFFTFGLVLTGGALRLDVEVPAGQVGVLDALATRAAALAGARP